MKAKRIWILSTTVALVALLVLAPCGSQAQQQTIQLKYVTAHTSGHPMNAPDLEWIKRVEERTGGRVKVTVFLGTMGKVTDLYDMVLGGVVDVTHIGSGWAGGRMPLSEAVDLPFEVLNMEAAGKVMEELFSQGLLKELDPFKVLLQHPTPTGNLFLRNKKVTTLEQMGGMKIRPIPGVSTALVESWKAVPVAVRTPDLYMAVDKGEIDGFFSGPDNVVADKLYEPCKYQLKIPTFSGAWVALMNKNTWNKLPPDIQKIVDQVNKEVRDFFYEYFGNIHQKSQALLNQKLEAYSLSPIEEARWRKAAETVTDKWVADMEAKGLPGRKVVQVMRGVVAKQEKK